MSRFEVTTGLYIHCKVKVIVEAESAEEAIDAAAELMPNNHDPARAKRWRATVALKPPRGVLARVSKVDHFEQTSGTDKAAKIADSRESISST